MRPMTAVLYPIAANAEAALNAPLGRAARQSEAKARARAPVTFVTEQTGPGFETWDAAMDAFAGRIDDGREGRRVTVAPEDHYCSLREVLAPEVKRAPRPQRPAMRNGRRWPAPREAPPTVWRLSVSYWKIVGADETAVVQPRRARRDAAAADLKPNQLRAMAEHPLRPVKPQQALDIGLFEMRPPEAPDRIIPDE